MITIFPDTATNGNRKRILTGFGNFFLVLQLLGGGEKYSWPDRSFGYQHSKPQKHHFPPLVICKTEGWMAKNIHYLITEKSFVSADFFRSRRLREKVFFRERRSNKKVWVHVHLFLSLQFLQFRFFGDHPRNSSLFPNRLNFFFECGQKTPSRHGHVTSIFEKKKIPKRTDELVRTTNWQKVLLFFGNFSLEYFINCSRGEKEKKGASFWQNALITPNFMVLFFCAMG